MNSAQTAEKAGDAVGLYLAGQQAYVARVRSQRGRAPVVVAHMSVTLSPDPAAAADQVRDHLLTVAGGRAPRRLWTCFQSPGMVLQALRVPQVRASAMVSAALWTLKKERSLQTEDTVFDIERLRTVEEDGVPRVELLAVAVPKTELAEHQRLTVVMGAEASGVSAAVFAFRNFLRLGYPELNRGPCAVLFVNDASSDVFVFQKGQVLAVRTLRTGLDSLRDAIVQKLDIEPGDPRADACLRMMAGEPVDPGIFGDDPVPSAEEVFSWGRPVARRLARNIQRTLHAFEDALSGVESPVFLIAGTVTRYESLVGFLGDQIGVPLAPFTPSRSETLQDLLDPQDCPVEESGMSLAIGLALADSYETPNLLFTFADRQKEQRRTAIARTLRVSMVVLLVVLGALVVSTQYYVGMLRAQAARLRGAVDEGALGFDKERTIELSKQAVARRMTTRELAQAYYAPGVVAEVAELTPKAIYLLEIHVVLAADEADPDAKKVGGGKATSPPKRAAEAREAENSPRLVRISGVIQGMPGQSRGVLADYVCRLQESPFFVSPKLQDSRSEKVDENYVVFGDQTCSQLLFFTVQAALRSQQPAPPVTMEKRG